MLIEDFYKFYIIIIIYFGEKKEVDPRSLIILNELNTQTTVLGMKDWVVWIIIAILLLVSGLYSASENAYTNCNKYHFKTLANKGSFVAKLIVRLIDKFDNTLITVLIGNNIIQTLMSFLSAMLFYNMSQAYGWSDGLEAIVSTVVMAALVYIISDTCPKILSKAIPNRMAYVLVFPVTFTNILLYPVILIFKGVLLAVHKIFKIKDDSLLSKEDLIHSASIAINDEVNNAEENEEIEEKLFENNEKEILSNAFTFDTLTVKNVYTPNEKVFSLNIDGLTISSLNKKLIDIPYSRIPIYEDNKENIIGILVLKTYFEEYASDHHLEIRSILENDIKVDVNDKIDDVFNKLNKEKVHLAIVYDGDKMVGIISMEDILEVLITDIDETPSNSLKWRRK